MSRFKQPLQGLSLLSGAAGGGAVMKSIQTGTNQLAGDSETLANVAIDPVEMDKTIVIWDRHYGAYVLRDASVLISLDAPDTLRFERRHASRSQQGPIIRYYVVEFAGGVKVQRGIAGSNATVDIDPVDLGRTIPFPSSFNSDQSNGADPTNPDGLSIINNRFTSETEYNVGLNPYLVVDVSWQILEFL